MSWDIFVQDFPSEVRDPAEIPDDFLPSAIGKRTEITARITEVMPEADFSDPAWGNIDGDDWSIEVNLGDNETCEGFALHVRGGNEAVGAVAAILQHLKLRGLDSQSGEFFVAGPEAVESFRKWREFRDRAVRGPAR